MIEKFTVSCKENNVNFENILRQVYEFGVSDNFTVLSAQFREAIKMQLVLESIQTNLNFDQSTNDSIVPGLGRARFFVSKQLAGRKTPNFTMAGEEKGLSHQCVHVHLTF